jgi:hypothetical protein
MAPLRKLTLAVCTARDVANPGPAWRGFARPLSGAGECDPRRRDIAEVRKRRSTQALCCSAR